MSSPPDLRRVILYGARHSVETSFQKKDLQLKYCECRKENVYNEAGSVIELTGALCVIKIYQF